MPLTLTSFLSFQEKIEIFGKLNEKGRFSFLQNIHQIFEKWFGKKNHVIKDSCID